MFYKELIIGLVSTVGILTGAEIVIRVARDLCRKFNFSEYYVGLTILSIGTSLPEIFTHIFGSIHILSGSYDYEKLSGIVIGTNIGSNIVQISLITGLVAMFAVIHTTKKFLRTDYLFMLVVIFMLGVIGFDGEFSRLDGSLLFFGYMAYLYRLSVNEHVFVKIHRCKNLFSYIVKMCFGFLILAISSNYLLKSAVFLTDYLSLEGTFFGVLILGFLTVIPEFTTAIIGIKNGLKEIPLFVLVGSNITNPMMGIGIGALISKYHVSHEILAIDLPAWFFISLIGFVFATWSLKLSRLGACLLFSSYFIFVFFRILS
ncbi:MAG: hypothetical protein ABIH35_01205 [Patescibacteria group bacterium]